MTQRISKSQEAQVGGVLSFCSNCHVSISEMELRRGTTRRTSKGSIWCTLCARADAAGRRRRRAVLEEEFADSAPISSVRIRPPAADRAAPDEAGAARYGPTVEQRVGHLERAVFRLQARVQELEERLRAAQS